jgi:hypothetical protein
LPGFIDDAVGFVTDVAEVVSYVPGPIGVVASGVAVAGNLVQGNYAEAAVSALGLFGGAAIGLRVTALARKGDTAMSAVKALGRFQAKAPVIGMNSRLFGRGKSYRKGLLNQGPFRLGWNSYDKYTASFRLGIGPARSTHYDMMYSPWI